MPYCKKLTFKLPDDEQKTVLYGIITAEDETFLRFKTGKKGYCLHKSTVLSILDTDRLFVEEGDEGLKVGR